MFSPILQGADFLMPVLISEFQDHFLDLPFPYFPGLAYMSDTTQHSLELSKYITCLGGGAPIYLLPHYLEIMLRLSDFLVLL